MDGIGTGVTVCLSLCLLLMGPTQARTYPITINADAAGSVWIRPSDSRKSFRMAAPHTPFTYQAQAGEYVDIQIRGRSGPFVLVRGEQQRRNGPATLTVRTERHPDWLRIGLLGLLPAAWLVAWLMGRHRRLHGMATELERRAQLAESRRGDPTRFGPYRVLRKLGRGGMATVYEVEDGHGDLYALKVPDQVGERSRREWRLLHRCAHPGIVRLHDFCEPQDPELPSYLVMERLQGPTLDELLQQQGKFSVREAATIGSQILEALDYAHSQGVVHRDLKPGNIFYDGKTTRIVDFGIAKADSLGALTVTGEMLGTPTYAAPEQMESKTVDHRCDLYAVGVILFELITGKVPWSAPDPVACLIAKAKGLSKTARELEAQVPENLDDLISDLLAVRPQLRPDSAQQALERLRASL